MENQNKREKLIQYYKNKSLLIVGLNDSQGVNTTLPFSKGLLEYLAVLLTDKTFAPQIINAFSLTINKTEHIDYLFRSNISLEEIKLSQIYSAISALEKVMDDLGLPTFLGKIGNVYRFSYPIQPGDQDIKISTSLNLAKEPILIYSSGVNNLMREIGSNPFSIKKDYKARNYHSNYHNIVQKIKDFSTIKKVIESIANNYGTILGINPQTDIYTLGAYIPKSLQKKDMTLFRDFIMAYNESLYSLCRQYGITFIDTTQIGKKYNKSNNNFHISVTGHSTLANNILDAIYQKKILSQQPTTNRIQETNKISNYGCSGMIKLLSHDYHQSYARAMHLTGYDREREIAIAKEHKRESEIFQKILTRQQKSH